MGATRIAMWSGPRNISTAMMRSWENRADTAVWDEPLYGVYLHATGSPHPGAAAVIAAQGSDWREVVARITGPVPDGKPVFYQKHMTHHLLPFIDRAWLGAVTNCFLIRDPREVLLSYRKRRETATLEDLGLPQQVEIFDWVVARNGAVPPVLDARDVLEDPERMLRLLCERLELAFTPRMLTWPAGPRASDGVWAPHWYDAVIRSTGFAPYRPRTAAVPAELEPVVAAGLPLYERLHAQRLGA